MRGRGRGAGVGEFFSKNLNFKKKNLFFLGRGGGGCGGWGEAGVLS